MHLEADSVFYIIVFPDTKNLVSRFFRPTFAIELKAKNHEKNLSNVFLHLLYLPLRPMTKKTEKKSSLIPSTKILVKATTGLPPSFQSRQPSSSHSL